MKDKLMAIRDLLSDESRWARMHYARDKNDTMVDPSHPDACRWCLSGAIIKVCRNTLMTLTNEEVTIRAKLTNICKMSLPTFNDSSSHEQVMALIERAINE